MSEPRSHHLPRALQPTDYEDMRAQTRELAHRAAQAGLSHVAYALEMVMVLLDDAEVTSGNRPGAGNA